MLGNQAARDFAGLRRDEAASAKVLYAIDGTTAPASPATELESLSAVAAAAVTAGGGHVLDTSHVVFPNGAITLVLILAESHLSVHTWPEEALVAVDLFSCGAIDGEAVVSRLIAGLGLENVSVRQVERGRRPPA